jgi:hypothetical protein
MRRNKSESQLNDSPNGKDFSDGDNSDESKDFVGLNSDDDRRTSFDDHTSDATFTLEQVRFNLLREKRQHMPWILYGEPVLAVKDFF